MAEGQRFLAKIRPSAAATAYTLAINGGKVRFRATPLFASIQASPTVGGQSTEGEWHVLEAIVPLASTNAWDVCHAMVASDMGVSGGGVVTFAEPDLAQRWLIDTPENGEALAASMTCEATRQNTEHGGYPGGTTNDWYRDGDHTGLASLQPAIDGTGVRIAHLDTGYDPEHDSTPINLERQYARNFIDDGRENDATDRASGLLINHGHGTGTLSILAGRAIGTDVAPGVAPGARIVPMRVADRVVLFHNSAIAKAFDRVLAMCQSADTFVDVVTLSMGGLASQAWAEAVNALYEAGVVVVTAAGNNRNNLPTNNIVFPARFNRVIAACGVMADHQPYADLGRGRMAGNYGPDSKMSTAMAAYTPNIPWARFGCPDTVRFNGSGTSSATPQIAGAAALFIQSHRAELASLPEPWMRAEAVRQALFRGSRAADREKLGNGPLNAPAVLAQPVLAPAALRETKPGRDKAWFGFLRVLTGLGLEGDDAYRQMLELEALQLSQSAEFERLLPDPEALDTLTDARKSAVARALAVHPCASQALRRVLRPIVGGEATAAAEPAVATTSSAAPDLIQRQALGREYPLPSARRLRIYAYDPSLGESLQTFTLNEAVTSIIWEPDLQPGPIGEYVEVVDVDPASGVAYAPIDLNDARLLATDGLRPSEANPQFHQQMVYAVAMKTVEYFEKALGRRALWAPRILTEKDEHGKVRIDSQYVQRLRIYPHALRTRNAYYSPDKKALLLGYFTGSNVDEGGRADQQLVFTALSSDIIAHETTHALLDGLHRRFREPTNPDVLAFHEAFADLVALFQHFTLENALRNEVARTRGNLDHESILSQLAVQFGNATECHGALRHAIGMVVEKGKGNRVWQPTTPSKADYPKAREEGEPHLLGSVLIAAVFDAFLQIYRRKALGPIRLATGGSEVLSPGALQGDLADALAGVAASVARQVLLMCIRALDYCPPVDITFGDFLRAIITADKDLVPDDPQGYRIAFASAFRSRGIHPESIRTVAVDALGWEPPPAPLVSLDKVLDSLQLRWDMQTRRKSAWESSLEHAKRLHGWLMNPDWVSNAELAMLGLERGGGREYPVPLRNGGTIGMVKGGIEVHAVRPLRRVGPDGQLLSQLVIELTQSSRASDGSGMVLRGGCTLIIDMNRRAVCYLVRKRADQPARVERQAALWAEQDCACGDFIDNYRGARQRRVEPFALLHSVRSQTAATPPGSA